MIELKNLSGFLNTDDSNEVMDANHHKMAVNGRFRGKGVNLRFESVKGNRLITNEDLPETGDNECIGAFYDTVERRLFYFNWNSEGLNGIYLYEKSTGIVSPLLICGTDSADDILNFDPDYPVFFVNIIYRSEGEGDILYWNDRSNRPMKLNIKEAQDNQYGSSWVEEYLTVARPMPLIAPSCSYQDDADVDTNNLRKKLYEFRYRWVYRDFERSTYSPYSKLFAPRDPDSIGTDIDQEKNNRIDVIIDTGPPDVVRIEVVARVTIGSATSTNFSDDFTVATLDKAALGLSNGALYTYEFFGDGSYLNTTLSESVQLFDYVPKKANAQELLNGNVLVYGGVTFGNTYDEEQDVESSVELVDNTISLIPFLFESIDAQNPIPSNTGKMYFYMTGEPVPGDVYEISVTVREFNIGTRVFTESYTVQPFDTLNDVISYFQNVFDVSDLNFIYKIDTDVIAGSPSGIQMTSQDGSSYIEVYSTSITYQIPVTPSSDDVNIACFKHRSWYQFGRVYFDEYGVTNGVVTYSTMNLEMPEIDTNGESQPKIPAITFTVNDQPPVWAKYFSWVRTDSLTFQSSLPILTNTTEKDTNYGYLGIDTYQNNQNNWPVYSFSEGDRVRIIGVYGNPTVLAYDFPVVDLVTNPDGIPDGTYIKVPFDPIIGFLGGGGSFNEIYLEVYTPALNNTESLQLFYEFGETYEVLNPGQPNRAHQGKTQDQIVNVQPAIYTFVRGDYYVRERPDLWIIDQSVSDLYPSKISGTGRAFVIDDYAKETYYPTTYRWGGAYQQETNINNTNRFYSDNFDEVDRQKGAIQGLVSKERIMVIFQDRGVGRVGVYNKFIIDSSGSNILSSSTTLITQNNVAYYIGDFGVGNQYTSIVRSPNAIHFVDPVRGYQCRLAENGITPISLIHKGQFYIQPLFTKYNTPYVRSNGYKAKIMGFFDYFEQECVMILQGGTYNSESIDSFTFSYNELRDAYCSFFDYHPEWALSVEDVPVSFVNGELYIHDNTTNYATFYGESYGTSITLVFNKEEPVRKTYMAIAYQANQIWTSTDEGIITSMINQDTGLQQTSELKSADYELVENLRTAAFLRDQNSMINPYEALIEGDDLKGQWIEVTLTYSGDSFAWLYEPYINYVLSPRNF